MTIYVKKQDEKIVGYYYSVYYKDVYGNSKRKMSKTFEKKKDCQFAEQQFLNEVNRGISDTRLENIIELYLNEKSKKWNERTFYDNKHLIEKHIIPTFGKMKFQEITTAMCLDWFNNIDGCAAARKNKIKGELNKIFKFCSLYTGIEHNPVAIIESEKINDDNDLITSHIWTVDEFNDFLKYVDNYELRTIFYLFFWTGLRFGELRGLAPKDINFESKYLNITCQVPTKTHDTKSRVKLKTKHSKRKVYFNQETEEVLKEYLEYIQSFKEYHDNCYLFGVTKPYSDKRVREYFHTIIDENGLKSIVIHDLRHCRASYLICHGYNIMFVCNQLGHKKPSMTLDVYSELMEDVNIHEANRLYQGQSVC